MKFKKLFTTALATILITTNAFAAINLTIDGQPLALDVPPTIVDGRTLVPVRAILESLGATVEWNADTQTVKATNQTTEINLKINDTNALVNGKTKTLDVPAQIIDGRTMVPARFVAENLNCSVNWDANTQTVIITTSNQNSNEQSTNLYKVVRVVDGDTFVIDFNGTEEKVRLIGVDTPESVHPDKDKNTAAGVTASEYTKSLLEGKSVELEFDVQERDKYGRLLAYVYVDGYMLNEKLLEDGYAVIATYPPNVKYVDTFKAIAGQKTEENENSDNNQTVNLNEAAYIGNSNTMKFHKLSCSSVNKISEENKVGFDSRENAIELGYEPCGICKP